MLVKEPLLCHNRRTPPQEEGTIVADFSSNLKRLRQAGGMSQAQLAEKLNVTRQTVSSWERGNSYPDIGSLTHLVEVLGVEVQDILGPPRRRCWRKGELKVLTPKFLILSTLFYLPLFWYGGVYIAIPFVNLFWTTNTRDERFVFVYWGIFLLFSYIGLCTCIISEYITNAVDALSDNVVSEDNTNLDRSN